MLVQKGCTAVLLAVMLCSCGPRTLDGSSDLALEESMENLRQSLPPDVQDRFDEAVQVLSFDGVNLFSLADPGAMMSGLRDKVDGKTADQIIREAADILALRREREREQISAEVVELQSRLVGLRAAFDLEVERAGVGSRLLVSRSSLTRREGRIGDEYLLNLVVQNDTGLPLSRVFFKGTLSSPGRSIPWLVEEFNYSIPGGLEAGEQAEWSLSPNRYSGEWANMPRDRNDTVFTVEVLKLEGVGGALVFDAQSGSDLEEEIAEVEDRLALLLESGA